MNTLTVKNKQGLGLSQSNGFTIIEVVLVLAIAALIFLMVFIALPALQRNQRDTARKTVLGKVTASVTSYQSNNRGNSPTSVTALGGYVDADKPYTDPLDIDNEYKIYLKAPAASYSPPAGNYDVVVYPYKKCDNASPSVPNSSGASKRNAAIVVKLENGDAVICQSV